MYALVQETDLFIFCQWFSPIKNMFKCDERTDRQYNTRTDLQYIHAYTRYCVLKIDEKVAAVDIFGCFLTTLINEVIKSNCSDIAACDRMVCVV